MTVAPFGTHALNNRERWARHIGLFLKADPVSKLLRSALWRLIGGTTRRPRDVDLFGDMRVRLHSYDNVCEKRVLLTPQLWEPVERLCLENFILTHDKPEFYFVDAGANVGLYTLFAASRVHKQNKSISALCIEPGETVRTRLNTNVTLSQLDNSITIAPYLLGNSTGVAQLCEDPDNLGQSRQVIFDETSDRTTPAITVEARPLLRLIEEAGFPRVDALKLDIEGAELEVMTAFFATAPETLWPELVIMEVAHALDGAQLLTLFKHRNYNLVKRHRGNIVLTRINRSD